MSASLRLFLAAVMLTCPATARAEEARAIAIPADTLSQAVQLLGRQAGVSIGVSDPSLWRSRVKGVHGRMSTARALERMLEGTQSRAVRVGPTSWRIERVPPLPVKVRRAVPPEPRTRAPPTPSQEVTAPDIIVTASKTDTPYSRYAGTATLLDGEDLAFGGERGTDSILARTASVASTHLGAGRNKLFIRGIADSSFTGPTQSTVGQYLGDVRLSYNAPDPDLRLHDIERVEVLEGPQGTLYGAGSLGGIIRVMPAAPDPSRVALKAIGGASITQHGDPGGDIASIVNLPLGENGHALRLVGYAISEGGYIDNPLRGQNDNNRTTILGGRATLRLAAGDDWTVDLGGLYQLIDSDDAQYADRDAPPLVRNSLVEQGAEARYGSATIVVAKRWDTLRFQSSTAYVDHHLQERFDASPAGDQPRIFDQENATRMVTNETRLWRPYKDGFGWVVGTSFVHNRTRQTRALSAQFLTPVPGVINPIETVSSGGVQIMRLPVTGVTNRVDELTAYGEASLALTDYLAATAGLRFTSSRLGGEGEDVLRTIAFANRAITARRSEEDLLPSFALLATPIADVTFYARYQEGFRPGGLAIDGNFVRRFRNDHVTTYEGGARFGDKAEGAFDASLSVSHTRWRNIQADFIDTNGFPTTANIGDGKITSISGQVSVRPLAGLSFDLGATYNHSRVTQLAPQFESAGSERFGRIPNIARHALHGSFDYRTTFGALDFRANGWANYIGPSRLGIGPVLGEGQGDYVDTGLAMRLGGERRGLSLTLTNIFDATGNRFALGTPFVPGMAGFVTPLRPRTVRLGIDIAY